VPAADEDASGNYTAAGIGGSSRPPGTWLVASSMRIYKCSRTYTGNSTCNIFIVWALVKLATSSFPGEVNRTTKVYRTTI
jgi:hypothetical protein